jgi:hypothetical protein
MMQDCVFCTTFYDIVLFVHGWSRWMSLPRLRGEDLRCLELSWLELMASRSESPASTHTYIHDDIMRPGVGTVENSEHHRSYVPYDGVSLPPPALDLTLLHEGTTRCSLLRIRRHPWSGADLRIRIRHRSVVSKTSVKFLGKTPM